MTQKYNSRTLSAITLGMLVISLAAGLIIQNTTDSSITVILWTFALIFGICLSAVSFMYSGKDTGFGPSESMYRLVIGAVLAAAGLVGMLYTFTDVSSIILAAVFIIIVAVIGIAVALKNSRKES